MYKMYIFAALLSNISSKLCVVYHMLQFIKSLLLAMFADPNPHSFEFLGCEPGVILVVKKVH